MAWMVPGGEDDVETHVSGGGVREIQEASHLGAWLDWPLRKRLGNDIPRIRPIPSENGPQPDPEAR